MIRYNFTIFLNLIFGGFLLFAPTVHPRVAQFFLAAAKYPAVNFAEQRFFLFVSVNLEEDWFWLRGGLIQLKLYITGHRAVATRQAKKADCVSSGCRRQTEMNGFIARRLHKYVMENTVVRWAAEETLAPSKILGVRKKKRKIIYYCCLAQRNQNPIS